MAQRVALVRALVNDPEFLILDEPLAELASLTRLAMQERSSISGGPQLHSAARHPRH
jgi:ABC-type nitrate/sulfonate/bicarbonate transport system ATPase subunit